MARAGLTTPAEVTESLAAYLTLLNRWNARINLTSLDVATPSDAAIDRLIVEPLAAARRIVAAERTVLDIGSGGGSPAVPLKLALRRLHVTMVESKVRKSAFLREVIRQLAIDDMVVENHRLEELLARPALHEGFDLVTVRAVRGDATLWQHALPFVRPGGRLFWFRSTGSAAASLAFPTLMFESSESLVAATSSELAVFRKSPASLR